MFEVQEFGHDCYGNTSGYQVIDRNGTVVGMYYGNIYSPESFQRAEWAAQHHADLCNAEDQS